ncbi:allophanate hydrolase [Aquimarina agarilytica]|uniref:allophanate hydrolase n=1 Tax=Aquimarina agarilytica TaxID=1087449 RepID=UPI0002891001|nr:allophanate hydrolase [Aquimarina agarilytica]
MIIQEIQSLLLNNFDTYKSRLIANQKQLIKNVDEEHIFISLLDEKSLIEKIDQIASKSIDDYPLLGVPFAVKDNIDVVGFATTAGCKAYEYIPKVSAFSVQQLEKAGAICIGKTNMDQFATGLVGTRSPYGIAKNYFNEDYIPGGSSSGSASVVAAGYVTFSLGTDTAGSGRVPAAFQNIIGFKSSKGIVSCSGVVPACKSLDCVSIFANRLKDVEHILSIVSVYDANDPYSRNNNQFDLKKEIKIAIPLKANLKFFGNEAYEKAYANFITSLSDKNYSLEQIDFTPMFEAAKLLYEGPWLSERYHAVGEFMEQHATEVNTTVLKVVSDGKNNLATSYFDAEYKLKALKKQFDYYTESYDAFVMPTVGTIYTKEEIKENPIGLNTNLGYYTNFMNLLDCTAVALPVSITENKLPFGITLFAPALNDKNLLST